MKKADAISNKILLGFVWQSNITQAWHRCRADEEKLWQEHFAARFSISYHHLLYSWQGKWQSPVLYKTFF